MNGVSVVKMGPGHWHMYGDAAIMLCAAQDCTRAAMALLVTGEDPESEDGRRLVRVVEALHQVISCCLPVSGSHAMHPSCQPSLGT